MKKLILMLMLCMPLATFAQKFGHVNAQDIMQSMPEFIKARGEVEAAAKQYDNDLKAMQDELQRKAQDYDKNASTMNETKKKETEESLQQMYQKIKQYQPKQKSRNAWAFLLNKPINLREHFQKWYNYPRKTVFLFIFYTDSVINYYD